MTLDEARNKIDSIDEQIAELFNQRQEISREISMIKKSANMPLQDLSREEAVMQKAESRCGIYGRELFQKLMDLSKKEQARYK